MPGDGARMHRHLQQWRFLLVGLALFCSLCNGVRAEIRIGFVTDLSGPGAFFGVQSSRGIELARREFLKAGIDVQVFTEDTRGITAEGVTAAERLISRERVQALICDLTPICTAVAPKILKAGVPLIFHSPSAEISALNPHAYRNFIDYVRGCRSIAEAFAAAKKPYALLAANLPFGENCLQGMQAAGKEFFTYRYNPGEDLRAAALEFRRRGIAAIMHVGYEAAFLNFYQRCQEIGYHPRHGNIEIMLSDVVRTSAAQQLEGSLSVGYEEVPAEFRSRLDREVPGAEKFNLQGAALGYNAVQVLVRALQQCGAEGVGCIDKALRQPQQGVLLGLRGWGSGSEEYPLKIKLYREGSLRVYTLPASPD